MPGPGQPLGQWVGYGWHPAERCLCPLAFVPPLPTSTRSGSPCRVVWLKFIAKFIEKLMRKAAKYWLWEENTTHLEWGGKCSNNLATIDLALSMYWSSFYNINLHLQWAGKGADFISCLREWAKHEVLLRSRGLLAVMWGSPSPPFSSPSILLVTEMD